MTAAAIAPIRTSRHAESKSVNLICSRCRSSVVADLDNFSVEDDAVACESCGAVTRIVDGIWRTLSAERSLFYDRFVADYEFVRNAEGRGSHDSSYYCALPFEDRSKCNTRQWAIRARTYRHLLRNIIQPLANNRNRALKVLDLGAGNGWLSYRLCLLGHSTVAVDILVNPMDGLAAATHYRSHLQTLFPRVQAEADALPFSSASFDLIIFNASFHYSTNYDTTMLEAIRCITPKGAVVIADSPWYANEQSGEAMIDEKRAYFLAKYGFPSTAIASQEYLTPDRLKRLSDRCSVKWTMSRPSHGINWALRPVFAKIKGRRSPSHFYVHMAQVKP